MKEKLKKIIYKHPDVVRGCAKIFNIFAFNKISIKSNSLQTNGLIMNTRIRIRGRGNRVIIGDFSRLKHCKINITGNNNYIYIGNKAFLEYGEICIEDDDGEIIIGDNTIVSAGCHIAEIEGTKIKIGNNCLFSAGVTIRTGDSHSILDALSKKRINYSEDIIVGDHVWFGNGATVLKGCHIADNCVIGTYAVVTKSVANGCIVAGNPARTVKENVDWSAIRIM